MEVSKHIVEIKPRKSVGPFKLNTNINKYRRYNLIFYYSDDITGWDTYTLDHRFSIYTERELIVCIACRVSCALNGVTIVGGKYTDFLSAFHPTNIIQDRVYMPGDDDYQNVYDVDEFGIQLWCQDDKIVSVLCSLE